MLQTSVRDHDLALSPHKDVHCVYISVVVGQSRRKEVHVFEKCLVLQLWYTKLSIKPPSHDWCI